MANEKDPFELEGPEMLFKFWLFGSLALAYVVIVIAQIWVTIPVSNHDSVIGALETLKNILLLIAGFYFGSSASASRNAKRLDKEREAKDQAQAQVNDQQAQAVEQVIEKAK